MRAQKSFLKNEEEKTKLSVVSNVSNKQALLFSVQKNILYSQKEVVKSVKNSTNEWNFAGIEKSEPDPGPNLGN